MYVCICARVKECDVRRAIRDGARCEESVGDACGAGTGCGTCLDRICDMIDEEPPAVPDLRLASSPAVPDLRLASSPEADRLAVATR
jgi:bacterioferritin-associated ferredoxin